MKNSLHEFINKHWYSTRHTWLAQMLIPFAKLFQYFASKRKQIILNKDRVNFDFPILVVGNISIGGVGKTPLVAALVHYLQDKGRQVGIVSRGFKGKGPYPLIVDDRVKITQSGDEPYMLYQMLKCPLVVDPDRVKATTALKTSFPEVDMVISDDGLQHYNLARDIEIVVVDGKRKFGNELCLPAGPLREPVDRLSEVDFVVINGNDNDRTEIDEAYLMTLAPSNLVQINSSKLFKAKYLLDKKIHAVAAIGNPDRFFNTLIELGYNIIKHSFPDHYSYNENDLSFNDGLAIIMTHKDAVKCEKFAQSDMYYLDVKAKVDPRFFDDLNNKIKHVENKTY